MSANLVTAAAGTLFLFEKYPQQRKWANQVLTP
jgi:hypothetical protein